MSYSRIPLVCQDFQLGYRTVNQAIENNNLMWSQMIAKHLTSVRSFPGDSIVGRHNDYFVPRSVACWFPQQNIDGSWFCGGTAPFAGASFGVPTLRDVGRWRVPVYDVSGVLVTAQPVLGGGIGSAIGRHADVSYFQPSGTAGFFADVTTWDITSGANPATAHMPFSLVLWANR